MYNKTANSLQADIVLQVKRWFSSWQPSYEQLEGFIYGYLQNCDPTSPLSEKKLFARELIPRIYEELHQNDVM
ncbi:hypothetical protein AM501_18665 [Aneurinibacillus migulanus]|uniref:hypothetical protein n=1 Tax=Aneurinibacillus migulanus TaxID=47500 RepID=UPI0005B7975C|nr:hypothetical protein [Aneurinibacillus migulanus]KIV54278.1 hypothetical protein TS64_14430 [Aneurinibacillus migulanus]KPD06662.1 hypothetical protein AM501_18665 [Aneurinibacillus migulanus]MCP1354353.1 hypothetical protein [Aneurinibacillus migulanus]